MDDIELISDPSEIVLNKDRRVNDVLGHPPGSILQFGPTVILLLLLTLVALAWFIRYPDIITARVTIVTEKPAIRVVSRTNGKINLLLISNDEIVKAGQELALLDNTANWTDIKTFEAFLLTLKRSGGQGDYLKVAAPENLSLGTLQPSYAALVQKLNDYSHFLEQERGQAKIRSYQIQLQQIEQLNEKIKRQEQTLGKEIEIANKNYARNQELNKEKVVSDLDLEGTETYYLQYSRQLENLRMQYTTNTIRMEELKAQIDDIKQGRIDGGIDRKLVIEESINSIQSEIYTWKQTFLIVAPIAGKVSMSKIWSEQQFVQENQEVMAIVPVNGKDRIVGKAILPGINSGKVRPGQMTNILLDGFPYQEFGVVAAHVKSISLLSQEDGYLAEIQLDSLVTTYKKPIPFKQEMSGKANIVVNNRRIIERVFDKLWSMLKN